MLGAIYSFNPLPVFTSLVMKAPYIIGATAFLLIPWWLMLFPISFFSSSPIDIILAGMYYIFGALAIETAFFVFIATTNQKNFMFATLAVVFRDEEVFIPPDLKTPIKERLSWRVSPDLTDDIELSRLFGTLTLVEVFDGTKWTWALAPGYASYHLSRLVERNLDWKSEFNKFLDSVNRELAALSASSASEKSGHQMPFEEPVRSAPDLNVIGKIRTPASRRSVK